MKGWKGLMGKKKLLSVLVLIVLSVAAVLVSYALKGPTIQETLLDDGKGHGTAVTLKDDDNGLLFEVGGSGNLLGVGGAVGGGVLEPSWGALTSRGVHAGRSTANQQEIEFF